MNTRTNIKAGADTPQPMPKCPEVPGCTVSGNTYNPQVGAQGCEYDCK